MKHKEESIIEHATQVVVQLHNLYQGGMLLTEFENLLGEYKKLYKRHQKVIKMGDNQSSEVMMNNDNLQENLNYTIKTARDKLLLNVTEHRKTKENIQEYIKRIQELESEIIYLKKKENLSVVENYPQSQKEIIKKNINPPELKNETIIKLIKKLITTSNSANLVMTSMIIDNFDDIMDSSKVSSFETFLKSTYKYLKNNFNKNEIVFHFSNEKFYILTNEQKIEDFILNLNKLNVKKSTNEFQIFFKFGVTKFLTDDNVFSFLSRCNQALEEAKVLEIDLQIK